MNLAEYKRAYAVAKDVSIDLSDENIDHFDGYGLRSFEPIVATVRQVARLMRWQAQYLNGGWDMEQLQEIKTIFRQKVRLLD